MNKKLLLCVLLMFFVGIKAQAYTWTDENGVTWTFYQNTYTINGEKQQLWSITGASGYGEKVIIPSVVYIVETPCAVEAIQTLFSTSERTVTSVTVPSTIKYINTNSLGFYAGIVTMMGTTPPTLASSGAVGVGVTVFVPNSSLTAYREAAGWSDLAVRILSPETTTDYSVTTSAQSAGSGLHMAIGEENLGNVMSLTVKGTINSYDIIVLRNKMHNLHYLDLTDATIVANSYPYYENYVTKDNTIGQYAFYGLRKLMTVKLPKSITTIENTAFNTCQGLRQVVCQGNLTTIGEWAFANDYNLNSLTLNDNLQSIGKYAFQYCYALKTLNLNSGLKTISYGAFNQCSGLNIVIAQNGLETIGDYAFSSCTNLQTVTLKTGLQSIGVYAFSNCEKMVSINLPDGLQTIGNYAFINCKALPSIQIPEGITTINKEMFGSCYALTSVSFPTTLKTISDYAFNVCKSLTTMSLPENLQTISPSAFSGCTSLPEVHIPSSVRSIGQSAFNGCSNLKHVYAYTLEPTDISENTFSTWTTATLHVPTMAYYNYYFNTQWSKFASVVEAPDYKYFYFYVSNDYTFTDNSDTSETPDAELNGGSGLIIENTTSTVTLGDVHMMDNGTTSGSIVANDNLTVENLYFDMTVAANKWYFLSLPFRVKQTNVTTPGNYIFRYYDGATRAANGSGGWKNYTGEYLEAHTGYIFQTNTAGTLTFQVEPADMDFSSDTRQNAMATHAAENAKNASWNFMGNPFPSYFDIDDTGYDAPITVWNGSSYIAVRPGDDQYHLGPFQAFFVQKPEALTSMEFPHSGCHTYNQWAGIVAGKANAPRRAVQQNRQLVNLTIGTDETVADRTRVVFNGQKTTAYELDCDAAKFLSSESVAQLYSLDDQLTSYAINERPMGEVRLGYVAAQNGMLTITAERMDKSMLLYDKQMNIYHDLTAGGYMFSTDAGTFNDRFVLTVDGSATAISRQSSADTHYPTDVYSLGGTHVSTDGTDRLSTGTYVVKQGNVSTKVIVK